MAQDQGCGIKGFYPTSLIQIYPVMWGGSVWEALIVVSQKWIPFQPQPCSGSIPNIQRAEGSSWLFSAGRKRS